MNFCAPVTVTFLQSQRINRLVSRGHDARRNSCFPKRVPQLQPRLHWAIKFPTEFADVSDAHGEHRNFTDDDLLCREVRKSCVGKIILADALYQLARTRSHDAKAAK